MRPPLRRLMTVFVLISASVISRAAPAIVCSFGIPADWAKQVAGPESRVSSLTPRGSDFHSVHPTPAQVRALTKADLVVGIHPELETWLADLEKTGDLRRPVLWLAKDAFPHIATCDCAAHVRTGKNHSHASAAEHDPHLWMDPDTAAALVEKLAAELATTTPGSRDRGLAYAAELRRLSGEIANTLARIPPERRKLVSHHDNLRRFAQKFGFTVSATLLASPTPEGADPSARKIAETLEILRKERIPAIFSDNTLNDRLPARVAKEAGLPPPVPLAVDSLDPAGTAADTYVGMMRENAGRIARALNPAH